MVGAIAFWDNAQWVDDNPYAQKKIIDFYKLTTKNFNSPNLILIDINNQHPVCGDEEIKFESYPTLPDAINIHKDKNFVFLEVRHKIPNNHNPISLKDFIHPPEDVYYVVGSDFGSIPFHELDPRRKNFYSVYIDTKNTIPLWSHTALAVALYDRSVKQT